MGWIGETMDSIKSLQIRQVLTQAVSLGMIVTSALIIWKALMCITGSESPVVVVLSGSMEPGFKRGDILFLHMSKEPIRAGEIVVFNVDGREIPIVHRVIKVHERQDTGEVDVLTKGDNNYGDDRLLYAHGQLWLQRHHIMGRAVGFLPYVGWVTIIMTEKPIIKGREIPIVHRVIKVHERQDTGEVDVLTKGDNNYGDDRLLYAHGQLWLQRHHIMGRAVGFLPYVGWVTIIMTEKPIIKYILIGALGLLVITSKD
uniref:Signal peptidase complex catalytic subunit SEC11 n=2 Tax=Fagaceae TaxID=3503 RepID=A0A7N2M224_QUELO